MLNKNKALKALKYKIYLSLNYAINSFNSLKRF